VRLHWPLPAVVSARGGSESRSSLAAAAHSPRYRRLYRPRPSRRRRRRRVAVHSTTTTSPTQCCCCSSLTAPETPYLYPLLAVWSWRNLSATTATALLLLCPARPIGHTPNPHPAPVAPSQQATALPPARPSTQDPPTRAPLAHSPTSSKHKHQHQPHPTRPHQASSQHSSHPAPAARLSPSSYTPIVLGRLLACWPACCLRACLCVVRRYASLQLLLACLLCAVVTTAPPTTARPPPSLRHAAPRAPPDLLLRRRRQQRGCLSSA